jgi:hypothetical protein
VGGTSRGWPAEAHDELDELEEDRGEGASPHAARHERVLRLGGLWPPAVGRVYSYTSQHLAPKRRLGSLGRPTSRPLKHSHLKKHTAVARATAGKVLASRCARQGQSTRRAILAAHDMKHLDLLVDRSSRRGRAPPPAAQEGTSPRGYQPRRSRPGRTGLALISKPARRRQKAHKINGGVLKHASREPTYRP